MRWPLVAGALVALTACVGPARSFSAYEGKAGATASAMTSPVQTVLLAARDAALGKAFGPYLSVTIDDAEKDASGIQGAFDSIQPPDNRSDQLRAQLDDLLSSAVSIIEEARIAVRRNELTHLPDVAKGLAPIATKLDQFSEAHRP